MSISTQKNHVVASNLFIAGIVFFHVPALIGILVAFTPAMISGASGLAYLPFTLNLVSLAFLICLALGIRAGKTWAKVAFVLYFAWNLFTLIARGFNGFAGAPSSLLQMCLDLSSFALLVSIAFFLFRDPLTHQSATGVAEDTHNRVN